MKIRGWLRFGVMFCAVLGSSAAAFAQFDPAEAHQLLEQANSARAKEGLPPLAWNDKLTQAAQEHAQWMANAHLLSHQVGNEPSLTERVAATHLAFSSVAENIAFSSDKSEDFHNDWMHSPGHRANLLSRSSDAVGIAVLNHNGSYYAVEDFAKANSADSPEQAEQRFGAAFNHERKAHKQSPVRIDPSPELRAAACAMAERDKAEARDIPREAKTHAAIAFTAFEPEQLPQPILSLAGNPQIATLAVGACFKATSTIPGGTYWFAVTY